MVGRNATHIATYHVDQVKGPWLWLRAEGLEGWTLAKEVVPVEDAIHHFSDHIQAHPNDPFGYIMRGMIWREQWHELDKALTDYNEAIRLDPTRGWLYGNRGNAHSDKHDYDKAIADYTQAIKLDPKEPISYSNRGIAWSNKKDYDKAIADHTEAIRLSPWDASSPNNRGFAWLAKKDYDKAIADYNEAIQLDSKLAEPHLGRAVVALIASRDGADRDARAVIERVGWKESQATYAVLIGFFAEKRAKREDTAKRLLDDGAGQCDREAWPFPILGFLRHEIDEDPLLALAGDDYGQTEARCYLGLDHLLAGRIDRAREHFRWVKEHGATSSMEYTIAVAELDRLEGKAKQ
jgi:tetratricopeptide (TPR) repeat protein